MIIRVPLRSDDKPRAGEPACEPRRDLRVEEVPVYDVDLEASEERREPWDDPRVEPRALLYHMQSAGRKLELSRQRNIRGQGTDVRLHPIRSEVVRQLYHLALGAAVL